MEFSKIIFLAEYVHYEVLNTKNFFLRFFLPFFSSKLALEICPFPLPFCSLQNADFLMGVFSVMSCQLSMPCPIAVSILETKSAVFYQAVATITV